MMSTLFVYGGFCLSVVILGQLFDQVNRVVNKKMLIADGVGDRLREERERLGLNQTEFGVLLKVSRGTQKNYELGTNSMDLRYVSALEKHGVDACYVVTGGRTLLGWHGLDADETELVERYRGLPPGDQKTVRVIVKSMAAEASEVQT